MPSADEIVAFLARVPLFKSLNKRQLGSLAKVAHEDHFKAGEEIVTQGESGVGLYVIASGKANVVHSEPDGTTPLVNILNPTDFFGELAMLSEGPRTATVVAVEDTECLVITRWNFLALAKNDAEMAVVIMGELARRFRIALGVL
jgi:CRP/FNR family cyclic AMP-dependent transcriptional regulator